MSKTNKILVDSMMASALAIASMHFMAKNTYTFNSYIQTPIQDVQVMDYNRFQLPANYCSRFVRLEAKRLFDIEIPNANAWDLKYENAQKISLENLLAGDIVTIYNPNSTHNNREDKNGEQVDYTHVGLHLGHGYIAHQFGSEIKINRIDKIDNLKPMYGLRFNQ